MTSPHVAADQDLAAGTPTVIEAPSPGGDIAVVFEDDGETGYFYALDLALAAEPIVDAICVYELETLVDRHLPCRLHILWSADETKAVLLLNRSPHAVFDFAARRGYCRSGYPDPVAEHDWTRHDWDETLQRHFMPD